MRPVHEQFPHLYRRLKTFGFSPLQAATILIEGRRGEAYALRVIRLVSGKR